MVDEALDLRDLLLLVADEAVAGGEQQLAALEPLGGVRDLGDVDPPHGVARGLVPGQQAQVELGDLKDVLYRDHRRDSTRCPSTARGCGTSGRGSFVRSGSQAPGSAAASAARLAPQHRPGQRSRVLALLDDRLAVHEHPVDALGRGVRDVLEGERVRVQVRRPVAHAVQVEDDEVGLETGAQRAPIEEAEALRREGGHLADGLLEAQHRLVADVALEHAGVLPVAARPVQRRVVELLRRRHHEPVGRDHRDRALQQGADVLLLDVVEEADDVVVLLDDEVEEGVEAVGAALGGDVGDGAAAQLRVAAGVKHDHAVEAAVPDQARVAGARQRVLERPPGAARRARRVREQRDERVVAQIEHRLRQRP